MVGVIDNIGHNGSGLLAQVAGITRVVRVVERSIGVLKNGVLESGGRA